MRTALAMILSTIAVTSAAPAADEAAVIRLAQNGRGTGVAVSEMGGQRRTFLVRSAADFARADVLSAASPRAAIGYTCQPATSGFCINDFPAMCGERGAVPDGELGRASTCGTPASGGRPQPIAASDQSPVVR